MTCLEWQLGQVSDLEQNRSSAGLEWQLGQVSELGQLGHHHHHHHHHRCAMES